MGFDTAVPIHKGALVRESLFRSRLTLSPPLLNLQGVSVGYEPGNPVLRGLDLRLAYKFQDVRALYAGKLQNQVLLPRQRFFTRDIEISETDGAVYTTNSHFPTWQSEGGVPTLLRITPLAE